MEDGILLEFNNFGFQYNAQSTPTLTGINFTLRRGERVLIAGPSGCGKSTMVHCINGLIPFSYKKDACDQIYAHLMARVTEKKLKEEIESNS